MLWAALSCSRTGEKFSWLHEHSRHSRYSWRKIAAGRVLLDVDAGVDDALAIILALRSPGPLSRPLVTAQEVHGRDGLGNVTSRYPMPRQPVARDRAVDVILNVAREYPHKVTLIATGPLTNVARAFQKSKKHFALIRELIIMGGVFYRRGNTGPVAEFNMFVDPEAAAIVLSSKQRITLVSLNAAQAAMLLPNDFGHGAGRRTSAVKFIEKFTTFNMKYHRCEEGFYGLYLHDPLAVGVATDRSLVRCRRLHVDVETRGVLTRGLTIATPPAHIPRKPTIDVAFEVDVKRFLALFRSRVLG